MKQIIAAVAGVLLPPRALSLPVRWRGLAFSKDGPKKEDERKGEEKEKKDQQDKDKDESQNVFIQWLKKFNKPGNPNTLRFVLLLYGGYLTKTLLWDKLLDGTEIDYPNFKTMLEDGGITEVTIVKIENNTHQTKVRLTSNGRRYYLILSNLMLFEQELSAWQAGMHRSLLPRHAFEQSADSKFGSVVHSTMYMLLIAQILINRSQSNFGVKGLGNNPLMNAMNSKVQKFGVDSNVKVRFQDVAGMDMAKLEVSEFVDFLKNPAKYKQLGARIPKGALLSGPPGTGKTMLAKAVAGQAGVPFFFMSGSDFVQIFVGVGASRVRQLFNEAKEKSPSIIFIDEIDAVGKKREERFGGNDEKDSTLNQMLVEMDGFGSDSKVIVLAATNRKEMLDNALTRPGRFDRSIDVTLPDLQGRRDIFLVYLKNLKLHPCRSIQDYAKRLATLTPGFSGADISNLCNQAAILAARADKKAVQPQDFQNASDRILAGTQRKKIVSQEQRKVTAFHQSGHAVVSWFLKGAAPLLKLTIVPRSKGSLGFAQYLPSQMTLQNREELLDRICFILGGRVAEQHFFGRVTTGAYDDLKKAYKVAHMYVTKLGMSERVGLVGFKEGEYSKSYSEESGQLIDQQIKQLIDSCTERTREMVVLHAKHIQNLAGGLLEKGTLDSVQITKILGKRPFQPKESYRAYLEEAQKTERKS